MEVKCRLVARLLSVAFQAVGPATTNQRLVVYSCESWAQEITPLTNSPPVLVRQQTSVARQLMTG